MTRLDPRTLKPRRLGESGALDGLLNRIAEEHGFDRHAPLEHTDRVWVTHATYEQRHPDTAEQERGAEIARKAQFIALGGTDEEYQPKRQFPCPGNLRINEDLLEQGSPKLLVECDACGWATTIPREAYDPQHAVRALFKRANLPEQFVGVPFRQDKPGQEQVRRVMREWLGEWKRWEHEMRIGTPEQDLTPAIPTPGLEGLPGRGKTHLLTVTAEYLIRRYKVECAYWPLGALLDLVRNSYEKDAPPEVAGAWRRALDVPLLVLDDIGAERPTEWAQERLHMLVDHRYNHALPILLATNVPRDAWIELFGHRTASRLAGMVYCWEMSGNDLRVARIPPNVNPTTGEVLD